MVQGLNAGLGIGPSDVFKRQGRGVGQGRCSCFGCRLNRGLGVQKVQDAGHGGFGFLDQRSDPAHRRKRPRKQVDVEHELEDVAQVQVARSHAVTAHIHCEDRAEPDQQHNQRHEHGLHFHEVQHPHFVEVCFDVKPRSSCLFAVKALQDAHSGNVLLHEAGDGTLGLLLGVAFPMDVGGDEVDPRRHQREGEQGEGRQDRVDVQHDADHEGHQDCEVQGVHDGRAEVHADVADIFADSIHQVAGVLGLVKGGVEHLVVVVNRGFQVVLDQPAHDDDCLACEEGKHAFDEVCQQEKPRLRQSNPNHQV